MTPVLRQDQQVDYADGSVVADVDQHTPRAVTAAPPSLVTSLPNVAAAAVMAVTAVVVTVDVIDLLSFVDTLPGPSATAATNPMRPQR